jgi:hypothetical protein
LNAGKAADVGIDRPISESASLISNPARSNLAAR